MQYKCESAIARNGFEDWNRIGSGSTCIRRGRSRNHFLFLFSVWFMWLMASRMVMFARLCIFACVSDWLTGIGHSTFRPKRISLGEFWLHNLSTSSTVAEAVREQRYNFVFRLWLWLCSQNRLNCTESDSDSSNNLESDSVCSRFVDSTYSYSDTAFQTKTKTQLQLSSRLRLHFKKLVESMESYVSTPSTLTPKLQLELIPSPTPTSPLKKDLSLSTPTMDSN